MTTSQPIISSEEFFARLIDEAAYVSGDNGEYIDGSQIDWLDRNLLEKGRQFVRSNSFSVMVAQMMSIMFGFAYKPFTSVIIRGGKFSEATNTYTRSVDGEGHIINWYESDILTPDGKGFKDIQYIRKLHANGLKRCDRVPLKLFKDTPENSKTADLMKCLQLDLQRFVAQSDPPNHLFTYHPSVFMSQLDLALVQFVLFGPICLFHDTFGIKGREGQDGFIHMWAVIGRLMGIQDRFNIALHGQRDLFESIFKSVVVPFVKDSDTTALSMQEIFNNEVSKLFGSGSFKSTLYVGLSVTKSIFPDYTGENVYRSMGVMDRIHCHVLQLILFFIYHFNVIRQAVNKIMTVLIVLYGKRLKANRKSKTNRELLSRSG